VSTPTLDSLAEGLTDEQVDDVRVSIRAMNADGRADGITDEQWERVRAGLRAVGHSFDA
jgi:NifB/MoaA-like Fe-S oxidoreductase